MLSCLQEHRLRSLYRTNARRFEIKISLRELKKLNLRMVSYHIWLRIYKWPLRIKVQKNILCSISLREKKKNRQISKPSHGSEVEVFNT